MTLDIGLTKRIFVGGKESIVTFHYERLLLQKSNSLLFKHKDNHFCSIFKTSIPTINTIASIYSIASIPIKASINAIASIHTIASIPIYPYLILFALSTSYRSTMPLSASISFILVMMLNR